MSILGKSKKTRSRVPGGKAASSRLAPSHRFTMFLSFCSTIDNI